MSERILTFERNTPKWAKQEFCVMLSYWNNLPDDLQLELAQEALNRAAAKIASQAEVLAEEFDCGNLSDHGGADALRLFAAVMRVGGKDALSAAGRA